jgi:hypothetical protein
MAYESTAARSPTREREAVSEQLRRGKDELREVRSEFQDIASDLRLLAMKERELAMAETQQHVSAAKNTVVFGALTFVATLLTLTFAFLTVMFAFDLIVELWLAALITTGILAGVMLLVGLMTWMFAKQIGLMPQKAIESVNEDWQWLRSRMTFSER